MRSELPSGHGEPGVMRRILLTNMYADLGGGELALLAHVRQLRDSGAKVLVGLLEGGRLESEMAALGAEVLVLPFAWQGSKLASARRIATCVIGFVRAIRRFRPEVVISYTFNDFVLAGTASRLCGVPLVYRAQGELFLPGRSSGRTWLGRWLRPFVTHSRARVVCTTRGEAEAMRAAGWPASRVTHVYLGTPFLEVPAQGFQMRVGARPVVGIFGRLARWKGQRVFVSALVELARRGVDFDAWVVGGSSFGDGPEYERELQAIADEGGITERVKFLGMRRDVGELMMRCDVVCHASNFEPFGLVVIEAMMAGKPVLASDVSGPRESVIDGVTGRLVPPGDALAYADALQKLLVDPDLRVRMGAAGRARAEEFFDLEKNLAALDKECHEAMRR